MCCHNRDTTGARLCWPLSTHRERDDRWFVPSEKVLAIRLNRPGRFFFFDLWETCFDQSCPRLLYGMKRRGRCVHKTQKVGRWRWHSLWVKGGRSHTLHAATEEELGSHTDRHKNNFGTKDNQSLVWLYEQLNEDIKTKGWMYWT